MLNYEDVLTGLLLLPAIYLWKNLYNTYLTLDRKYKEEELFRKRHNCVVMYSKSHMRGWPPEYNLKIDTTNLYRFLEPYLLFINSAKSSLNISMMRIAIDPLFVALHEAVERGVKVRLIVNFLCVKSINNKFRELLKSGVKIAFFIDKTEKLNYIMHCKYMIKDYDKRSGYLCMGSLNFTSLSTVINNFEDVTFTSNATVVGEFQRNFEDSWNLINRDNNNIYNRTVLADYGFQ